MAWITSGLTNLKVQLNSLINDEEGYSKPGSDLISEEIKREFEEPSQNDESNLKKDFEKSALTYSSPKNFHEYRKHSIMVYCKRLSICCEEVVTLNSSLNFLVEQLTTTLNAHDILKNELIELRKVLFDFKNKKDENSFKKRDTYSKIRRSSHSNDQPSMLNVTRNDFIEGKDSYYDIENVATNSEMEKEAVLTSYKLSDETTKQIESLTVAVDEAKKMRHLLQKNLSEILVDTEVSEKLDAVLKEYFDYDELNSTTWQKLKLLFMLPVMAKFKSANISELSVSDSVKEAFQPNCSMVTMEVCPSNERNLEIPQKTEHSSISSESKNVAILPNVGEECAVLQGKHSQTEELNRLRKHLLSVEHAYTNELLKSEQEIQLLRRQLQDNDKKLTSMTESHTSLNVRTNQTIETLQNEVKKLSEDNQRLLARFKDCQIELQKSLSETCNIRSALDLFYKNRDSEIFQVTEKLRSSIKATEHENETLRKTVEHLREDLALSAEQLKEQNILSNEMKTKEDEISVLRNEVFRLQTELKNSNFKTGNAKLDSESAMKFNLIKNIVFRYATSDSSITRMQSLRVLANVLEFSDYEKSRVGLCVEMDEHPANESLIGEFIRFVEKESLPKCDEVFKGKVTEHSKKSSHSRSLAVHSSINDATSSILKDVLHSDNN